ncbi:MAG: c-type cytochrome [Chlorobiaceae bacterium]|jgi:cytochrome c oxidase cbb3-type subunit III|nr:c-type cytochrome [Chlorobiaceae bacterium]
MNDTGEPQEGHNKIPAGWLIFFFAAIIFLIWYVVSYTPAISGWSFYDKYKKEMASAAKTETAAPASKYAGDEKAIGEGKEIFASNCAACHNADATGGIGPNLIAELKYGSTEQDLYISAAKGRPNGMPGFLPQLGSDRIIKVVAYLEKLRKK